MQIIGITGTIGAGKGTVVDYLIQKYNYKHFSVRGFLLEEIKNRGLDPIRDNMVIVANDLRAKYKPSYIVEQLYLKAIKSGTDCIIESVRNIGEVEALRQKDNFKLIAVDALPEIRYKRITNRKSETDNISFAKFLEDEALEMTSKDKTKQNLLECIKLADVIFNNNESVEDLYNQIERFLNGEN